ncbi:MAG: sulfurtransferase [Gammaproteobacteria bacterium]|nr:sulfurtransferase [Gammaproteobacteria bacterium]
MKIANEKSRSRGYLVGLLGATALVLAGCNGSEDSSVSVADTTVTLPTMNSPATIAAESAADYDDNTYGLITGDTLANWIADWDANKPSGIDGKLVILQTGSGEAGSEYIAPNGVDVFTYEVGSSEWVETRSNGVIETRSMVPSGQTMDNFLSKYNIDPSNDMIVCAQGTAGAGQAMRAGRCWYMFRYWGVPAGRLAMLNGGNGWNDTNTALTFATTASTPPMTGYASVKDLPQINFALQATLEDMLDAVPDSDTNVTDDGVFIWDARGNNLPASLPGSSSDEYSPDGDSDFRNGGATQGHPNGALLLSYSNLLDSSEGYTFKSKADLAAYLDGETVDGAYFVDGTLQGIGVGNAYQSGDTIYTYCETTYRAMVTGFATAAILGKPTRFYDGAMVEWHSMANAYDKNGDQLLPADSPWRTDKNSVSMYRVAGDSANVDPRTIVDADANTAHQIIIDDLAYKGIIVETDSDDGGSSGGGGEIPNPCGG